MNFKQNFYQSLIWIAFLSFGTKLSAQNGLVGSFSFKNGNAVDESATGINGIPYNVSITKGFVDSAYYFNGVNGKINCGTNDRGITNTVTLSAWVKTTSSDYMWIIGKYQTLEDKGFYLAIKNGQALIGGRNNGGMNNVYSPNLVNDGQWHHIMGVIYNNTWELWVDCQLKGTATSYSSSPDLRCSEPLTIGDYNYAQNGLNCYFSGLIDEVKIYNRLLSNNEKLAICNRALGIEATPPQISLTVAPNPANETCRVEYDTRGKLSTLTLTDALGRVVKSVELENKGQHELSVADVPAGLYYLHVNTAGKISATGKLLIEKQ